MFFFRVYINLYMNLFTARYIDLTPVYVLNAVYCIASICSALNLHRLLSYEQARGGKWLRLK